MMTQYRKLFREFINGATDGQHRKIQIVETDDSTLLVGYGHAVYAERDKESGSITLYEAWASGRASQANRLHCGTLRQELDKQSMFHQVAKQSRLDVLRNTNGAPYERFEVSASK